MVGSEVRILTQMIAAPEQEANLKQLLLEIVDEQVHKAGCVRCELLHDQTNLRSFLLLEDWLVESRLESDFFDKYSKTFLSVVELLNEPLRIDWYEVSAVQPQTSTI